MSQKTIEFHKLDQVFSPLGFALGGEVPARTYLGYGRGNPFCPYRKKIETEHPPERPNLKLTLFKTQTRQLKPHPFDLWPFAA